MVSVEEYARIRQAYHQQHLSIRQLVRRFHHPRRKIRDIPAHPETKPYQRRPLPSVLDPFKPIIDAILHEDEHAPHKQRHTAANIFRRLRDEHGDGGSYEPVRLYLLSQGETFIPLDHDPGQRLEYDFGHSVEDNFLDNIGLGVCFRTNATSSRVLREWLGQSVDLASLPDGVAITRFPGHPNITRINAWE